MNENVRRSTTQGTAGPDAGKSHDAPQPERVSDDELSSVTGGGGKKGKATSDSHVSIPLIGILIG